MNIGKLIKTIAKVAVPTYMLYEQNKDTIKPIVRGIVGKKKSKPAP